VSQATRVKASGMRSKSREADKLKRLLVELTDARDLAHAVPDGDHIVYMIEMAMMEVVDRSNVDRERAAQPG
jgi:hypothetical protein